MEKRFLELVTAAEKEEISIIVQHIIFSTGVTLFIDDFETTAPNGDLDVCPILNDISSKIRQESRVYLTVS